MGKKRAKKKVAKKKASAAKTVATVRAPRKEKYTSKRMVPHIERLRELAARISGLSRAMDDAGVKSIDVDGHAMLLRGLNQIENFADNATRAVREEKNALLDS